VHHEHVPAVGREAQAVGRAAHDRPLPVGRGDRERALDRGQDQRTGELLELEQLDLRVRLQQVHAGPVRGIADGLELVGLRQALPGVVGARDGDLGEQLVEGRAQLLRDPEGLAERGGDLAGARVVGLEQQGRVEDLEDRLDQDARGGAEDHLAPAELLLGLRVDAQRLRGEHRGVLGEAGRPPAPVAVLALELPLLGPELPVGGPEVEVDQLEVVLARPALEGRRRGLLGGPAVVATPSIPSPVSAVRRVVVLVLRMVMPALPLSPPGDVLGHLSSGP
jgi:hypothetical protein